MVTSRPPRSTFQRAVLPVVGGIAFFALLGLATWGVASILSRNPDNINESLAKTTYTVGNSITIAAVIDESGPLILPDLMQTGGTRTVVLDHTGPDPRANWRAFYAHPADRPLDCKVTQIRGTREFTDCEGRTLGVEQLMPPAGVVVEVGDNVTIDLTAATAAASDGTTDATEATDATTDATTGATTGTGTQPATSEAP